MTRSYVKLRSYTQRPRQRHSPSALLGGRGEGGGRRRGQGEGGGENGGGPALDLSLGHHCPELEGLAMAVISCRKAALTSSPCYVSPLVPLKHIIASISPVWHLVMFIRVCF